MRRRARDSAACASLGALITLALAGCSEFFLSGEEEELDAPLRITETFDQAPLPQVDLLWVIDDTPSMSGEHAALAAAMPAFAAELESAGVGWQVGVVTTDPGEDIGVLQGDPWVLTPADTGALRVLLDTADITLLGREPTRGLEAMRRALSEPLRSGLNQGFRRPDAALHVIIVSDGDDGSEAVLGTTPLEAARQLLDDEAAASGRTARVSAIVGPEGGCSGANGTALPGTAYLELAETTGGAVGSICEADLGGVAASIGAESIEWQREFPLQATPAIGTLRVSVDGARLDRGWALLADPAAIAFDEPPPPGAEIVVRYAVDGA